MADVQAIGIDETSSRRGHDYITLFNKEMYTEK
jgi:hypothetical protein